MSKQKDFEGKIEKIKCPSCGNDNCYVNVYDDKLSGYLCYTCGMTSNTQLKTGSSELEQSLNAMPEFVTDNKFYDEERDIYWFLSVIQTRHGMVFPEPNEINWHWVVAKVIPISEKDKELYPVPGKEGKYYASRLAIEEGVKFDKNKFKEACEALGGVLEMHKEK